MKKETPHSEKGGAGLADGLDDSGARCGMPTTGRDQRQKRSPKEQSAVSGTLIQVSQVVLDHPGRDHVTGGPKATARLRPARSLEARGPTRPIRRGWSSYAFGSGSLQPARAGSTTTVLDLEAGEFGK